MPDTPLKVVVADDDEPICNLISDMIGTFEGVTVAGKASTGKELLEMVKKTGPDAVFVDVHMPGLDGLSVIHRLQKECPGVFTVFVTAYTQYAAEAFNLDAADYLVKPVDRNRIGRALARVRRFKQLHSFTEASASQLNTGPGCTERNRAGNYKKLTLKIGHGIVVINPESIFFVEKLGKKCIIHTDCGRYETSEQLSALEQRLDLDIFFRCHKSFIINVHRVEKVLPFADRAYEVTFYNYPHKVTMRRDKFEEFCRMIRHEQAHF